MNDDVFDNNGELTFLEPAKDVKTTHREDILVLAVAPDDDLVCSGSQVRNIEISYIKSLA